MVYALIILFVVVLLQDIWFRGVYWFIFPAVLLFSLWLKYDQLSLDRILLNVTFLFVLLGSLTLYLSIKNQELVNITKGFFSWGDILFLLSIVPLFEPYVFVTFFTLGTILSLLIHVLVSIIKSQKTVPYAGYMALVGIAFLLLEDRLTQMIYLI